MKSHRFSFKAEDIPSLVLNSIQPFLTPVWLTEIKRIWYDITASKCRVYLMGHGDWQHQKIGGWDAAQAAQLCKEIRVPTDIGFINVLGCRLGRDVPIVELSTNSFGSRFHFLLGDSHSFRTRVFARVYNVLIHKEDSLNDKDDPMPMGIVGTSTDDKVTKARMITRQYEEILSDQPTALYRREESKKVFYWEGTTQKWKWVV